MRRVADALMALGLTLGAVVSIGLLLGNFVVWAHGLSWLLAIGIVKLTLAGALGLIAGGAALRRLANRAEERRRLGASTDAEGG